MKALIMGGLGVVAAIGSLYALNLRKKKVNIPRKKVLEMLKALRQQMYIPFLEISCWVKENSSKLPPDTLRGMIVEEENPFRESMNDRENKIFTEISKQDFEECLKNDYSKDVEIQYNLKQYQEDFEKALLGVSPELKESNIIFLNPEQILDIARTLLQTKISRLKNKITQKIRLEDLKDVLVSDGKEDAKLRIKMLKQLGFSMHDSSLIQMFEFAIAKYQRMDEKFTEKYTAIERDYEKEVNSIIDEFCCFPV